MAKAKGTNVGDTRYLVGTSTLVEITEIHEGVYGRKFRHGMVATARVITPAAESQYMPGDIVKTRAIQAFVNKPGR
jgi:hypothetical protein